MLLAQKERLAKDRNDPGVMVMTDDDLSAPSPQSLVPLRFADFQITSRRNGSVSDLSQLGHSLVFWLPDTYPI